MYLSSELLLNIVHFFYSSFDLLVIIESFHGFEDESVAVHFRSALEGDVEVTLKILVFYHG